MIDKKLTKILKNIAILLEIKGENPFKSRAYSNAAEVIENENLNIAELVASGNISSVKGFGEALQKKLTEYVQTGSMSYYENLIAEIPETLVDITSISSIGPKKAKLLWENHGITNLEELELACVDGKIQKIKGFSAKSQEMILNSIHHKMAARGKHLQSAGMLEAELIAEKLRSLQSVTNLQYAGVMRRFDDTYDLIEFVATGNRSEIENLISGKYKIIREESNELCISFLSPNEIPYRLYFSDVESFGSVLHQRTGSEDYLEAFKNYLIYRNIDLSGRQFTDESELFATIGLQFIASELREDERSIIMASENNIPDLVQRSDLKGMLHVHSKWSDGNHTIREMAQSAKNLGFSYIAICDHSRSASYANGLDIDRVKMQHDEIDRLNGEIEGITILKGIESDILPDGSLDYPDSVLESFDLVVASVHSNFTMSKADMTRRIGFALMSPYTDILGHPTGRLLTARPAYEIDIEEVIEIAAAQGKIIEINCNPYRLDLSWRNTILAKDRGVKIAINPDSHHKDTMSDVDIGIKVARKGWLTRENVVNTLELKDFIKLIGKKSF
jgi:DNA polymerase (family 10)